MMSSPWHWVTSRQVPGPGGVSLDVHWAAITFTRLSASSSKTQTAHGPCTCCSPLETSSNHSNVYDHQLWHSGDKSPSSTLHATCTASWLTPVLITAVSWSASSWHLLSVTHTNRTAPHGTVWSSYQRRRWCTWWRWQSHLARAAAAAAAVHGRSVADINQCLQLPSDRSHCARQQMTPDCCTCTVWLIVGVFTDMSVCLSHTCACTSRRQSSWLVRRHRSDRHELNSTQLNGSLRYCTCSCVHCCSVASRRPSTWTHIE